jgi:Ca-activated chloride channel family protein
MLAGLLLILLGAARLQGKPVPEDLNLRGIDVMVVLDVSKSMLTQDIVPNRLGAAKKAVISWLQNRDGDRVGLVVFAGEAIVQVPLTLDLEAVSLVLDRDDVDAVDRGGTDIGEGIRTALTAFEKDDQSKRGKAILLITDGETTDGSSDVSKACLEAKEKNVPVVAVGIGTRQGRPIPDGASFWGEALYKKNRSGNIVISHLDEQTLKKIANSTNGMFIQGENENSLESIGKTLDGLQRTEMKGKGAVRREELAPSLGVFSAGALLLSALI